MADDLAFSAQVKEELAHLTTTPKDCQLMELAALMRACGKISIGGEHKLSFTLSTDYGTVARKMIRLLKGTFGLKTEVLVVRRRRLRKNLAYIVRIPAQPGLNQLLKATGILDEEGNLHEWGELAQLDQDFCRRAYLRGTFLGTGWVSAPERQHHMEMTTTTTEAADALGQMLFGYGIPIRMAYRKDTLVLYLKDAAQIVRFLSVVGAHQSLLHYEDVRVMKEMKNLVNRQVNAETANLNKTVEASARQIEAFDQLRATGNWEHLSDPLKELAILRIKHPEANLKELGELCMPTVSKSGINHRMRQLMKIAESIELN